MMKKLIAILLTLGMMVGFSSVAYADNGSGKAEKARRVVMSESMLEFSIQTVVDENHVVTRTYTPPREGMWVSWSGKWSERNETIEHYSCTPITYGRKITTCEDVRELLSDLGVSDTVISDMDNARLMEIAHAKSVTTQIAYLKGDAEGNVTYVTEEEALQGTGALEILVSVRLNDNEFVRYEIMETGSVRYLPVRG